MSFSDSAKWIWAKNADNANTWVNLRKTFYIDKVPDKATADIAAESRYWLYINGSLAVFEGGLKRGLNPHDGYFDTVDIAKCLKKGKNTIAAAVWYYGSGTSFSSASCDCAGFLFQARIGEHLLVSDQSWKAEKDPAYLNSPDIEPDFQPNYRLIESDIYYDANKSSEKFYLPELDDTLWQSAKVCANAGDPPYNTLYKRPIPLTRFSDILDYQNGDIAKNVYTQKQTVFEMHLPYNAQVTPYLEIETDSPRGVIYMHTDTYGTSEDNRQIRNSYVTCKGHQVFEALSWFSGETVKYTVPAGVKIIRLGYRESGYDTDFTGSFECDDSALNCLWQKSLRTLYITMRDNYMDCPDRERTQWWGDVTLEMMMGFYALDKRSYALYEKGVYTKLGFAKDSVLHTVVPQTNYICELPMQELAGICGVWEYYLYSGNSQIIKDFYSAGKSYLDLWDISESGLVKHRSQVPRPWMDWMDWGKGEDVAAIENAWYCMAVKAMKKMARLLGYSAAEYDTRIQNITSAYQSFWTKDGYKSDPGLEHPDDRANALAVLADIAPKERYKTILNVLTTIKNSSPYMEKYVLDAIVKMGAMEKAQQRIKERYAPMIDSSDANSTLWEFWDKHRGTKNHAWSGGPLITMSKHMAGIMPLEAGYKSYIIKPDMGTLCQVSATVPAVTGNITVKIKKERDSFNIKLTSPEGSNATVALPKLWKHTKVNAPEDALYVSEDEKHIYYTVRCGEYTFVAKQL